MLKGCVLEVVAGIDETVVFSLEVNTEWFCRCFSSICNQIGLNVRGGIDSSIFESCMSVLNDVDLQASAAWE